ncbi:choice-of-anchor L domain-containing protein [Stagnihabitans tardus]|uniref:Calcium-binding protein n=1 Tax=Stagnihabitans tardus TaxID=2699202 RepID=A0AAE4YGB0_9RHOB|nr:choice-of-anchor L domain-containing protein [Stagnihabitans tardus]NBZ89190.1 hypothetical protein [Stagnihabitans tardus]
MPVSASLLPITTHVLALQMAETMFGDGVKVVSASYEGDPKAAGIYDLGTKVSPGAVPSAQGVILSTGNATRFTNASGEANASASTSGQMAGVNGDAGMNAIAGVATWDAAFLSAKFVPVGDTLTMRLVFASEEYLEWVSSGYNDAVGIWVNGKKIALALGDGDISIDNINTKSNPNLFLNNGADAYNTEMDGLTVVLTLKAEVKPGEVNDIRIGIADAGDRIYDSALLIVADSVQTALIAVDDAVAVTAKGEVTAHLLDNDTVIGRKGVHITHLNDQEVVAGQVVKLGTGDLLRLNADGSVTVLAATAGTPVTFTYQIADDTGTADTGFVTLTPSPVDGSAGNDQMHLGFTDAQGNMIDGSDGLSEVIMAYGGDDKITAGLGDDEIHGGTGNDFIRAGEGQDLILGAEGNDVLDGQSGADTMQGGAGDDVYYLENAGDVISETGGAGRDKVISTLSHVLALGFEELWLAEGSAALLGTGNAADNKIVGNARDNSLSGLGGADQLFGEGGSDTLQGGAGDDNLYAGSGLDGLFGGDGRDKLFGGTDSDSLYGGTGADTLAAGPDGSLLVGGEGNDLLSGGAGADLFAFAPGFGRDTVKGFEIGVDHLDFGGASGATLRFNGGTVLISFATGESVTIGNLPEQALATLDLFLI